MQQHDDELLDLVDEQDRVIGTGMRSQVYAAGLSNVRAVNAFLVNDKGQLWIPRRTAAKKTFPLCLDMSVAGHVASGEEYLTAFRRELQEELQVSLDDVDWRLVGHFTPHQHGMSCFMQVYEISTNQTPEYNRDDFVESYWLYPKELLERLQNGEQSKNDLPRLVQRLYLPQGR